MAQHTMAIARLDDEIAIEVAEKAEQLFGLVKGSTLFANNTGNVVMARRLAWYVLYMRWRYSYPQLERIWDFDQSTIRTGVMAVADELKFDRDLQQKAKALGV